MYFQRAQISVKHIFYVHPKNLSSPPHLFADPESKTIFGVELKKSTEDHVWREAFTSVFDEQSLFKNAAGDLVKAVLRVWGWVSLDLALYQVGP